MQHNITSDNIVIKGYASIFNIPDLQNDIILTGAFNNINDILPIKLLWQHIHISPIGMVYFATEDNIGLKIEATVNTNIATGKEAAILIMQSVIQGLSIGFTVKEYSFDNSGNRIISKLCLQEISVVTFPAHEMANILEIHN